MNSSKRFSFTGCKNATAKRIFRVAFMLLITGPTLSRHFWMLRAQYYPSHSGAANTWATRSGTNTRAERILVLKNSGASVIKV